MSTTNDKILGGLVEIGKREKANMVLDRGLTDVLRLISCLLVAGCHYAQYCEINNISENIVIRLLSTCGGYLGVAFFFFISGYGLASSMKAHSYNFGEFVKRRLKKVFLPAAFITFLWICSLLLIPGFREAGSLINHGIQIENDCSVFWNILFFRFYDSVLWFVEILLWLNLVFYLYAILRNVRNNTLSFPFLCLGTTAIMVYTFYHVGSFAVVSVPLFVIGVLVATFGKWIYEKKNSLFPFTSLFLVLFAFIFRKNNVIIHGIINYSFLLVFLWIASVWNIYLNKVPSIIPKMSYDLYLTHNKLKAIIAVYYPTLSLLTFLLSSLLLSIVSCYLRKIIKI